MSKIDKILPLIEKHGPEIVDYLHDMEEDLQRASDDKINELEDKVTKYVDKKPAHLTMDIDGATVEVIEGPPGEKGDKGDEPSDERLADLIIPLIPEPIKGDDGITPTQEELLNLIYPLIPEPIKRDDGYTPTRDELIDLMIPLIPEPVEYEEETPDTIVEKINKGKTLIKKDKLNVDWSKYENKQYEVKDIKGLPETIKKLQYSHAKATPYDQVAGGGGGTSGGGAVSSVNGQTGIVVLTTNDVAEVSNKKYLTDAEETKLGHITVTQAVDLDTIESDTSTNNAKVTNATHTGDVTGATALTIANSVVGISKLSATGTPNSTTFLRGDNVWSTPAGSGDVVGPASSVTDRVVTFNGTTGKLIKDSGLTLSGTNTGDNSVNTLYSGLVSNATHTGDVTGATALTIATAVVTNAKLADMATKTYKGRTSAATGVPEDVSVATLKTDLVLVKADVGLGDVDNTSDVNKPVSTAQQTAINAKFTLPALTSGSVLFSNGATIAQDNANFFWDNTNKRLALGAATADARLKIVGTDVATAGIFVNRVSTNANAVTQRAYKARGTVGAESTVVAADEMYRFEAYGYGTSYVPVGSMTFLADTVSGAVVSGSWRLSLADSAGTNSIRMSINSFGNMGIGMTPSAVDGRFRLGGNVSSANRSTIGAYFTMDNSSIATDTASTGTVAIAAGMSLFGTTFAATSATTYTNASTLYIAGPVTAGTNVTITTPWALHVNSGNSKFGGGIVTSAYLQFGTSNQIIYDSNANEYLKFSTTASAVNELTIANATTTQAPQLQATGGDADIGLNLVPKGTGRVTAGSVNILTTSSTDVVTNKRVQPRTASSTTDSTLTPDLSSANIYFRTTQTGVLTIEAPIGTPVIGETIVVYVDSAAAQTLTMNATYKVFGSAFPATTTAGKTFQLTAQFNGTDWKTLWANAI